MFDMVSTTRCIVQAHPLLADLDEFYFGSMLSVGEMVDQLGLDYENYGLPSVMVLEEDDSSWEVPIEELYSLYLNSGQMIHVFPRVEGQTGGSILSLGFALLAGPAAGALGLAVGTFKYALFTTAFTAIGGLIANMLVTPPSRGGRDDQNYAITGTSNVEAKHRPVPLVCGRMRIYPPKSARGFSSTRNNDIYWTTRLCLGYGPLGLEDIKIGDRPITSFNDVQIEFLNVNKDFTLANNPGLSALLANKEESEYTNVETVQGKTGEIIVSAPEFSDTFRMTIDPYVSSRVRSYDIKIYKRSGSSWSLVRTLNNQSSDYVFNDDPSGPTEYRVTWDGVDYDDGPRYNSEGHRVYYWNPSPPAVTISSAYASLSGPQGAWRYGTEVMQLYSTNVQEDQYSVVLQEDQGEVFPTAPDAIYAEVDITYASGIYDSDDGETKAHTAEYRIDRRKLGTSEWTFVKNIRHKLESTALVRQTEFVSFPRKGTYEIRVTRTNEDDNDSGDENTGTLSAIRTFKDERLPSHKGIAEMAIRIKASEQLNGNLDTVNAIVQKMEPKWDGTKWGSPVPTRHPAWAFGNLVRGVNVEKSLSNSNIDLAGLRSWANQEPGWTFDYVFDSDTRMSEALSLAAAAGRAKAHFPDLKLSAIRDGAAGPLTQAFGPHNSRNFQGTIRFRKDIHGFIVKVRSEALGFEFDEIVVYMDGYNRKNATLFETLELPGVVLTNADVDQGNAFRLARYHLAQHYLRPETWTFETDFEWITTQRGGKVKLTSDTALINVGQARIKDYAVNNGGVTSVTLSDIFPGAGGVDFLLTIRRPTGEFIQFTADPNNVLDGIWQVTSNLSDDDIARGDLVVIEDLEQPFDALVVDIEPLDDEYARITCVPASPEVLNAEEEIPPYDPVVTFLPDRYGPPVPFVLDIYSDERSHTVARDGTIQPRIAVVLAPYYTNKPTWFRLRWSDPLRGGWINGRRQSYDSTLFTDEIVEDREYTVEVRAEDKDGNYQYWVFAGTINGSVDAPKSGPINWEGRPTVDGIELDGYTYDDVDGYVNPRGVDVAGWNIYASATENGEYVFITFVDSLKTLIKDTQMLRWFRFARVNHSGKEGPLGPAFYVPSFPGLNLSDMSEQFRDDFNSVFDTFDDVVDEINGDISQLRDDFIAGDDAIKGRLDVVELETGDNAADIQTLDAVKVTSAQAISAVNQEISASYGSLSAMASATSFAKATADVAVTGHMFRAIGGYWELVGMNDGATDTSITRIRSDRIRLAGDTQIAGDFLVSGNRVQLDANTIINGGFQVVGSSVRLDSNTVVFGSFQVSGASVRLDANTVINGNFVVGGDHIILDGNTQISGSFEVSGDHIYLTSSTRKSNSFVLTGRNIKLDGDVDVTGSFGVTNANIRGTLGSDTFNSDKGWRLYQDGDATFRGVVISRQLQVATGTMYVSIDTWEESYRQWQEPRDFYINTGVRVDAWTELDKTYVANVGLQGGGANTNWDVGSSNDQKANPDWGWEASVLAQTKWWTGGYIYIVVRVHSSKIYRVSGTLRWRLYQVT